MAEKETSEAHELTPQEKLEQELGGRPNFLSPTLREKKRYLAYEVIASQKIPFQDLTNAMWHAILNYVGEMGAAEAGAWIMKNEWNEEKSTGMIRCNHTAVEKIRAALALLNRVGDAPIIIRVIGVSGSIKAAEKKYFGARDLLSYVG